MRRFLKGFQYAGSGILRAVREERNFRFHVCAAVYVLLFSRFYAFSGVEYALLIALICGVFALELINSAIERAVDAPDDAHWGAAGAAKDMAAGAVLVFCIGCVVCAVFLFWNLAVFAEIYTFFTEHLLWLLLLIISFMVSYWFIFYFRGKTKE